MRKFIKVMFVVLLTAGVFLVPATPVNATGTVCNYTVKSGDTLNSIARAKGTYVQEILALNPSITNLDKIVVGQTILVRSYSCDAGNTPIEQMVETKWQPTPGAAVKNVVVPAPRAAVSVAITAGTYIVQAGDTLSKIAQKFSTTVATLVANNGLASADKIVVGQQLVVATQQGAQAVQAASQKTQTQQWVPTPDPKQVREHLEKEDATGRRVETRKQCLAVVSQYIAQGRQPDVCQVGQTLGRGLRVKLLWSITGVKGYKWINWIVNFDNPGYSTSFYQNNTGGSEWASFPGNPTFESLCAQAQAQFTQYYKSACETGLIP